MIIATIGIIMMQKNGESLFSNSKVFGARGRSNFIIKLTYVFGALFLINNMILAVLYKKRYNKEMVREVKAKVVAKADEKVEAKTETEIKAQG